MHLIPNSKQRDSGEPNQHENNSSGTGILKLQANRLGGENRS